MDWGGTSGGFDWRWPDLRGEAGKGGVTAGKGSCLKGSLQRDSYVKRKNESLLVLLLSFNSANV